MEHGDIHPLAANSFNGKAIGGFDVFEIDRAKGRLHRAYDLGQLFRVGLIKLDVEAVDVGELLEQNRLAFHHRL